MSLVITYIEDSNIEMPNLKNGVTKIGDLWNCQTSQSVGWNLFESELSENNLDISVIKESTYELTHIKTTKDELKKINIKGELSVEYLAGLIKVSGSAEYDSTNKEENFFENLLCKYYLENYIIDTKPSAKEKLDKQVVENLIEGTIKATHVVKKVVVGADINANIKICKKIKKYDQNIEGDFFGKIIYGAINANLKANLELLDKTEAENYETIINLKSKPPLDNPLSIEDMFRIIDNVNSTLAKEQHFKQIKTADVYGVPIRYVLVPIDQFLVLKVEKLFLKLKDYILEQFEQILLEIKEFEQINCIKKRIISKYHPSIAILTNSNSIISHQVKVYEDKIRKIMNNYFSYAQNIFKEYKISKKDEQSINKFLTDFNNNSEIKNIDNTLETLVEKCKFEMTSIKYEDGKNYEKNFILLTDEHSLQEWFSTEMNSKILLKTKGDQINGLFKIFYKLTNKLKQCGFEIAIALPMTCEEFSLSIKVNSDIFCYQNSDILHSLKILEVALNEAWINEMTFYNIYWRWAYVKLKIETTDLKSINYLIKELKETNNIHIANSESETKNILSETDSKWRVFIPLDAIDTAAYSIDKMKNLLSKFKNVEWVAGNIQNQQKALINSALHLFVIQNKKIHFVIANNFDYSILEYILKANPESYADQRFEILKLESIENLSDQSISYIDQLIKLFPETKEYKKNNINLKRAKKEANNELEDAIEITRCILKNKYQIHECLIEIIGKKDQDLQKFFELNNVRELFRDFDIKNSNLVIDKLNEYLFNKCPLFAQVKITNDLIVQAQKNDQKYFDAADLAILNLLKQNDLEPNFVEEIKKYTNNNQFNYNYIKKTLTEYLGQNNSYYNQNIYLISLIDLVKSNLNPESAVLDKIIKCYIERIPFTNDYDQTNQNKLLDYIKKGHLYLLLKDLVFIHETNNLDKLFHKQIDITDLNDFKFILDDFIKKFDENLIVEVFRNKKFVYLMTECMKNNENLSIKFLNNSLNLFKQKFNKDLDLPKQIFDKLIFSKENNNDIPQTFKTLNDLKLFLVNLQQVQTLDLPEVFHQSLKQTLIESEEIKQYLQKADVLDSWNDQDKYFKEKWSLNEVNKMLKFIETENKDDSNKNYYFADPPKLIRHSSVNDKSDRNNFPITFRYQNVMGCQFDQITIRDFITVKDINEFPSIRSNQLNGWIEKFYPYFIQKIKMWGCNLIKSENLSGIIEKISNNSNNTVANTTNRPSFGKKIEKKNVNDSTQKHAKVPFSRLDLFTYIFTRCDEIVVQDLVKILSKFCIALPLIIHDIQKEKGFICLLPQILGTVIKWEISPGSIVENSLFETDSNFNMIISLRIGNNKRGKSTILNQIFSYKNVFSSSGDSCAEFGKPSCLDGSVEFIWLTEETCCDVLWNSIKCFYLNKNSNRVLLLANLHGNALNYLDHLAFLKKISSNFLIFVMPENDENSLIENDYNKIEEFLGQECVIDYLQVDYDEDNESSISTSDLTDAIVIKKITDKIKNLARFEAQNVKNINDLLFKSSIKFTRFLETLEGFELIKFIQSSSCEKIKILMENPQKDKDKFNKLVELFSNIIFQPSQQRNISLAYVEKRLNDFVYKQSNEIKLRIKLLKDKKSRILEINNQKQNEIDNLNNLINQNFTDLDSINLGLEHFYRVLAKQFKLFSFHQIKNNCQINDSFEYFQQLHKKYAEMLIDGQSIELLNGDNGDVPIEWLNSILNQINILYPNLRIFVISIIGLQSSGKSTLLNALFGCKFAVSTGRCTRGLFLRLMFLDENLKNIYDLDAIIIIDAEGLGSPEKVNDKKSIEKDRLLASFVMGISNLVLINVLGEYMNSLTDILQIAIVILARIEQAKIPPDILLIQHLTERNVNSQGVEQFKIALEQAINITKTNGTEAGISNSKSLACLFERIQTGSILKQFRNYKSGATVFSPPSNQYHEDVVDLFKTILNEAKKKSYPFVEWKKGLSAFWDAVSSENFAVRFKTIMDMQECMEREKKIAKIKMLFEIAFRGHIDREIKPYIYSNLNVDSKKNVPILNTEAVLEEISTKIRNINKDCSCQECSDALDLKQKFLIEIKDKDYEHQTINSLDIIERNLKESHITTIKQMYHASFIQHNYNSESIQEVDTFVKEKLDKFSQEECMRRKQEFTDEILKNIEDRLQSKTNVLSVTTRINHEIQKVYRNTPLLQIFLKREFSNPDELLTSKKAYLKRSFDSMGVKKETKLEKNDSLFLNSFIKSKTKEIFSKEKEKYDNGDIEKLKQILPNYIQECENKFSIHFLDSFRWVIHEFALKKFITFAIDKEEEWNKKYSPLKIFERKKQTIKKTIEQRLEYGYDLSSEASLTAIDLLQAIKLKSKLKAEKIRIQKILNRHEFSDVITIRFKYFEKLVKSEEVKILDHFSNPSNSIENWFKTYVDSFENDICEQIYKENIRNELSKLNDNINDKNVDLITFIENYFKETNFINRSSKKMTFENEDFYSSIEIFRNIIVKKLDLLAYISEIENLPPEFKPPFNDSLIMDRLGCIHFCPMCTAICWGERDHHKNTDDTNKHHTSHQPMGLAGVSYWKTRELVHEICSDMDPSRVWYINETKTTWSEIIKNHSSWKFQKNIRKEFDEIMCWFFYKYNNIIAEHHNENPTKSLILEKWKAINIDDALFKLRSEFS